MDANYSFFYLFFWGLAAFIISILMELLLRPRPGFRRPLYAWLCQFGLFMSLYAILLIILGRPLCSAGALLAFYLILVLVNNAKFASLREPFLYHDYDYFLDVIRFPRLYLPFLGLKKFILCAFGCLLAIAALMLEDAPTQRFGPQGQIWCDLLILALGFISLFLGSYMRATPAYAPLRDYSCLGFPAFLFIYGLENWKKIKINSRLSKISCPPENLPHLIAIQSESFFDPRILSPELDPLLLANLDQLQKQSFLHGFLDVPAWGANTVRTEFAFLTGIDPKNLGPHQFNPYRAMLAGWIPQSLPYVMKSLGYETICLHPWHAAFYGRKRLFPKLGFNKFLDLKSFSDCPKSGAYVDDRCLANKIMALLEKAQKPLFIFVITMENHGPLQDDNEAEEKKYQSSFMSSCHPDCTELPIYLAHLHHADLMLGRIHKEFSGMSHPVSLCFYGDHVPIMPCTYKILGYPKGHTPYFCWNNYAHASAAPVNMPVYDLAQAWLEASLKH